MKKRQGPILGWNCSRTGNYLRKFTDLNQHAEWPNNLQKMDVPYIRYTEVLLNYLEASINVGTVGEAIACLNFGKTTEF